MGMIKGIAVTLFDKVKIGTDGFDHPIYKEVSIPIENVLVAPVNSNEIIDRTDLKGKKVVYNLAIPKGDTHIWEDRRVRFFGRDWHTVGFVIEGIEANIPLEWNRKVMVERIE